MIAVLCVVLSLFWTSKSKKISAAPISVIEIAQAPVIELTAAPADTTPIIDPELTGVTISTHDGIRLYADDSREYGLLKQSNVRLTDELSEFAQTLSKYFADNNLQALITSGVRTSARQLDLIKERITQYGQLAQFPELADAQVSDTAKWLPAWQWLKARHVPVNPPADVAGEDGAKFGGSLHLKGLALDLVADDLDALKLALEGYRTSKVAGSTDLSIIGLVRERDCVHISLSE